MVYCCGGLELYFVVGGDGCRYVGVNLLWCLRSNYCARGLGLQYLVACVDLENQTLVSCGGGLES